MRRLRISLVPVRRMNRVLPPLDAIISSLLQQVAYGKAHLRIAKGLAESDPAVLNAAKTFFAMTIDCMTIKVAPLQ
jgi:hypothetical protein